MSFFTLQDPLSHLLYFFIFLGSSMQFFYSVPVTATAGVIVFIYFLFLSYKKYYRQNLFLYSVLLFIFMSAALASLFRLHQGDITRGMDAHYGIVSIIGVICCVLSFLELYSANEVRKKIFYPVLVLSLLYNLSSDFFFYPEVVLRKDWESKFIHTIKEGKTISTHPVYLAEESIPVLRESMEKKIFVP